VYKLNFHSSAIVISSLALSYLLAVEFEIDGIWLLVNVIAFLTLKPIILFLSIVQPLIRAAARTKQFPTLLKLWNFSVEIAEAGAQSLLLFGDKWGA